MVRLEGTRNLQVVYPSALKTLTLLIRNHKNKDSNTYHSSVSTIMYLPVCDTRDTGDAVLPAAGDVPEGGHVVPAVNAREYQVLAHPPVVGEPDCHVPVSSSKEH